MHKLNIVSTITLNVIKLQLLLQFSEPKCLSIGFLFK